MLINVYGGPQAPGRETTNGADTDFLWFEMMAEKGYIIFTLDNRGSYWRGHAFETPIYHQLGKVELEDQLTGVKYLKSLPYVDGSRIGIWGWSYGGTMTLEAMFNAPDVFKAGVADRARQRLAALRHDLHRALHGPPAGQSRRLHEIVARESGRAASGAS